MNAAFTDAHFTAKFDTGAALGTVDLFVNGPRSLPVEFDLAGDRARSSLCARRGAGRGRNERHASIDASAMASGFARVCVECPAIMRNAFFFAFQERVRYCGKWRSSMRASTTMNNDERLDRNGQIVKTIW